MDKSLGKALTLCTKSSKHSSPFPHRLGSSAGFAQPTAAGPLLSALPSIDPSPSPFSGCGYSSGSFPKSGLLPTGSSWLHGPTSAAPELQPPSSFTLGAKGASVQTVSIWKAAPPALRLPATQPLARGKLGGWMVVFHGPEADGRGAQPRDTEGLQGASGGTSEPSSEPQV